MPGVELPFKELDQPVSFVDQSGFARILGVSRQRIHQLKEQDALPPPNGILNDENLLWTHDVAEEFARNRNRALGKVSLQE